MRHIYDVGRISVGVQNVSASTLLYKKPDGTEGEEKGKLYCAYEVNNDKDKKNDIVVVELTNRLYKIKKIIATWKAVNKNVTERFCCLSAGTKGDDTPALECKGFNITNGLAGYLSETSRQNNKWEDEYLCVHAAVTENVESVIAGSKFAGVQKAAKWPAKSGEQNQPYHFANYEFTFVVTVVIHKEPAATKIPLLGVVLKNLKFKQYGLYYTNYNWLTVTDEKKHKKIHDGIKWVQGKQYQVVLSRKGQRFRLHVGAQFSEEKSIDDTLVMKDAGTFSHFYFATYDKEERAGVTVTNAFLYNRQLTESELKEIKNKRIFAVDPEEEEDEFEESFFLSQAIPEEPTTPSVSFESPSVTKSETYEVSPWQEPASEVTGESTFETLEEDSEEQETSKSETTVSDGLNSATSDESEIADQTTEKMVFVKSTERPETVSEIGDTTPQFALSDSSAESEQIDDAATKSTFNEDYAQMESKDGSGSGSVEEKTTLNSEPNEVTKEKEGQTEVLPTSQSSGTSDESGSVQAREEKEEAATPTATFFGAAGSESPAADKTSLRGGTNAGTDGDALKALLQLKGGDGAVRSCASLLPSLCLWCFLTAFYCCQAVAA